MNNNSNNCGDCGTTCSECGRPWAICKQDGGCGCNKCKDIKFCEYGRMANGCIREKQPGCPMQAVIPSVTVESIEGIKNLADCLVHVSDINTTFYIDDKHRPIITWAGPIDIPGYDMEGNPNNYRDQIVTDVANQIAVIYDKSGKGYLFGLAENIDLQEQVDNKLEEMVADGTLEEIVGDYLDANVVWGFDTVSDMQASTNLIDGSYARTLGYYAKNDGGGALYKIVQSGATIDGGSVIAINESFNAQLIIENDEINVNQFGAYGDATHDDTDAIQAALNYATSKYYQPTVRLLSKPYLVTNLILRPKNTLIGENIENSKLLAKDGTTGSIISLTEDDWHYCRLANFTISCRSANNEVENAILIEVTNPQKDSYSTFENLRIYYIPNGNGFYNKTGGREIRMDNINIRGCGGYGLIAGSSDSLYYNLSVNWCKKAGIWNTGSDNRFVNCKCYCNGYENEGTNRYEMAGFYCTGSDATFSACEAQENDGDGFYVSQHRNQFINCKGNANGRRITTAVDDDLVYSGFYVSTSYVQTAPRECTFIIQCGDFRRNTNRQVQKNGIDITNLQKSVVIATCDQMPENIHYNTVYSINDNLTAQPSNYVVCNGEYLGLMISNGLMLQELNNVQPKIVMEDGTNLYRTNLNNGEMRIDYFNAGTYKNTPLTIRGNQSTNSCTILTNADYTLNFRTRGVGFFGATPHQQETASADATDLATAITLVNNLKRILQQFGLIKTS